MLEWERAFHLADANFDGVLTFATEMQLGVVLGVGPLQVDNNNKSVSHFSVPFQSSFIF